MEVVPCAVAVVRGAQVSRPSISGIVQFSVLCVRRSTVRPLAIGESVVSRVTRWPVICNLYTVHVLSA